MKENISLMVEAEHAQAQAEALTQGLIEFGEDEKIYLTDKGIRKAFELFRERPITERYICILLIEAIHQTQDYQSFID